MRVPPETLLAEANCFACYGMTGVQLAEIALLRRIVAIFNEDAMTDPNTLLEEGKCFNCYSNASLADIFILTLLSQLSDAVSGGVGNQYVYQDRPPAAPDDPTLPAFSFPTGGGVVSQWDVASQTWV